ALATILVFAIPSASFPHPHVFIYNSIKIVFDKNGLAGFNVKWVFDDMFSNMIINDYDKNKNLKFDPYEIGLIKRGAFSNLNKFDYFTHIKIDEKTFKVKFVKNFSAQIKDNTLIYRFFVPCRVKASSSFKEVKISIYDNTFYCSVFLTKNPIGFENALPFEHHHRIGKNKKEAYYYGQVYPTEITLRFKLKNG
ncbi:MAG: DUF1007 family protein, partial [Thermodesulfobacteriota bacterium]|nr:DUF1007 family protein [Thermodesulfobacteriota bacterium]